MTNLEELKETVETIEKVLPYMKDDSNEPSLRILLNLAQSYISAIEKGMPDKKPEIVMVYHSPGIEHPTSDIYAEGFNACHDRIMPFIVKKNEEIAKLEAENKSLREELKEKDKAMEEIIKTYQGE